jgi:hypothetical protein
MDTDTIVRKLQHVGNVCSEALPHLNHGGCGVYATKVGEVLQRLGCSVRCRIADGGFFSYNLIRDIDKTREQHNPQSNQDWEKLGLGIAHMICEWSDPEGKCYATDSLHTVEGPVEQWEREGGYRVPVIKGSLTFEEGKRFADDASEWNPMFNRAEGIPVIDKALQEAFP